MDDNYSGYDCDGDSDDVSGDDGGNRNNDDYYDDDCNGDGDAIPDIARPRHRHYHRHRQHSCVSRHH
jgi:hypothetical protein